MAKGKLTQSEGNVQRLLCDKDAMRKLLEEAMQNIVDSEFKDHMGRKPYKRDQGRSTHRKGFKDRILSTRVGKIYLRVPQTRDGSISPSVYENRKCLTFCMMVMTSPQVRITGNFSSHAGRTSPMIDQPRFNVCSQKNLMPQIAIVQVGRAHFFSFFTCRKYELISSSSI